MTETIQQSLLHNLLKSRYPLTHYLSRQQEFIKVFSTTQTNIAAVPSQFETNVIRKRKTVPSSCYKISNTSDCQSMEFNETLNEMASDQDYNTAHDQSSEDNDDTTQEYDQRPILKSVNGKNAIKQ